MELQMVATEFENYRQLKVSITQEEHPEKHEVERKVQAMVDHQHQREKQQQPQMRPTIGRPNILIAPKPHHYFSSGFVHCCIIRNPLQSPLRIRFIFQKNYQDIGIGSGGPGTGITKDTVAMIAIKQNGNRTSNYHIFDTGRFVGWSNSSRQGGDNFGSNGSNSSGGSISSNSCNEELKLDKKAGNYIGKLRREKKDRSSYSLYDNKKSKEQIGAFMYTLPTISAQWTEGQPPRKMQVAIPSIDKDGTIEPRASYLKNRLIHSIRRKSQTAANLFSTKEPTFDNGHYRLNFNGRVTAASVKNMQLVDQHGEIFVQFGKVGEHRFHLDYKEPFNALQAFAVALTAMDL